MVHCKILIIDDDQDDVEILSEAFVEIGVNCVHHVDSALKAFVYLDDIEFQYLPALIVTDLHLPGTTGEEFLRDLKAMEQYKHIQVIILSSETSDNEKKRFRALGALAHLTKPSNFDRYVTLATNIKGRAGII